MNILHYSLGLPPYRTGGLTKYSFDLMKEQAKNKDKIYLLFPGRISLLNNKTKIKYYKNDMGINVYEIVNPLAVPLLNGISEPQEFMKSCDKDIFKEFLLRNDINVVHIHTFMGLHKELLESAKELYIKVVYTTHDYFGICTKVNFIDNNGCLCEERNLEQCLKCNNSGYSLKTIKILQSPIYRLLKNKGITLKLKILAKKLKQDKNVIHNLYDEQIEITTNYRNEYNSLMDYYKKMFECIDYFLFNSNVARNVYKKYIECNGQVISITHGDIKDNRKIKDFNHDKLKLTYLGPDKKYKGFDLLIDTMKELNKEYKSKIELNLYGDINQYEIDDNIKTHGKYSYDQLEQIFDNTDLLVVPSIWNETFGFIVLEALSYGVPVLVSDKVGSKDIIISSEVENGIIIKANKLELKHKITELINARTVLKDLNKNVLDHDFKFNMHNHTKNIESIYEKVLEQYEC
ncbi:glycosyltransferase [Clostridium botulinum]|uniref:glycosyltransferase n=1 Tax=Clostridium botulinum TaxID=1491 RepID=UPI0013CDA03E|nr:glycosyltransferase [Clostridium botulinum]MBN1043581.1 glycosyltransferase [Clostridium botulinum]NFN18758.1 glycosyltransferase [Clostridium botulinum]NFN48699.1 glycosyltransferase [Clostridium botulinum]